MKIYKFKTDIDSKTLANLEKFKEIGLDTEAQGLRVPHDKLSLIQLSGKSDEAYIIQPDRTKYNCPNLVKLFENKNILFVMHFARFDKKIIEYFLKCTIKNFFCTKISSKIIRRYSSFHGLKDLTAEFVGKKLEKKYGASDWNNDLLTEITEEQATYAANDSRYLISIKNALCKMMEREGKMEIYNECIKFLPTRIKLDLTEYNDDPFQH